MKAASKHTNKLLLLGVLIALVSMAVSSDFFQLEAAAPNFFEAFAAKWDLSLKPGKLIQGGFGLKGLFAALK